MPWGVWGPGNGRPVLVSGEPSASAGLWLRAINILTGDIGDICTLEAYLQRSSAAGGPRRGSLFWFLVQVIAGICSAEVTLVPHRLPAARYGLTLATSTDKVTGNSKAQHGQPITVPD